MTGIVLIIDRQPGFYTVNMYLVQFAAARESITANARHPFRDRDARQAAAVSESIIANARHACRDRDARQFIVPDI